MEAELGTRERGSESEPKRPGDETAWTKARVVVPRPVRLRAEVSALRSRREQVTTELFQLAGMIEAPAVPENGPSNPAEHRDEEQS